MPHRQDNAGTVCNSGMCMLFYVFNFCQTPVLVLRQGVDFVLPLSQEQQEEQPPPKSIRKKCTTALQFGTWT